MWATLNALGPWGILASSAFALWRMFASGTIILRAQHDAIVAAQRAQYEAVVALLQREIDKSGDRERELRGQAVISSNAVAKLASVLTPERRHDDREQNAEARR